MKLLRNKLISIDELSHKYNIDIDPLYVINRLNMKENIDYFKYYTPKLSHFGLYSNIVCHFMVDATLWEEKIRDYVFSLSKAGKIYNIFNEDIAHHNTKRNTTIVYCNDIRFSFKGDILVVIPGYHYYNPCLLYDDYTLIINDKMKTYIKVNSEYNKGSKSVTYIIAYNSNNNHTYIFVDFKNEYKFYLKYHNIKTIDELHIHFLKQIED